MTLTPLQPVRGKNLAEYRAFRKDFKEKILDYSKRIEAVRKGNPDLVIPDSEQIQSTYGQGLELLLVEAIQGEKKFLPLGTLTQAVGVKPSDRAWESALHKHIVRAVNLPENASSLIETVKNETGFNYEDADQVRDHVAYQVVEGSPGSQRLDYLIQLMGKGDFSEGTSQKIHDSALRAIQTADFESYDRYITISPESVVITDQDRESARSIAGLWAEDGRFTNVKAIEERVPGSFTTENATNTGVLFLRGMKVPEYDRLAEQFELGDFDDDQKERIRTGVINALFDNPTGYHKVGNINQRAKIVLTATPDELKRIVKSYFENKMYHTDPKPIADALNQELDPEQISSRLRDLLEGYHGRERNYDSRRNAIRLFENTGIKLSEADAQQMLRFRTDFDDKLACLESFSYLGYKPGRDVAQDFLRDAYQEDQLERVGRVARLFEVKPANSELEGLIASTPKGAEDKYKWILKFMDAFEFTPSEDLRNETYRELLSTDEPYGRISGFIDKTESEPPTDVTQRVVSDLYDTPSHGLSGGRYRWNHERLLQRFRNKGLVELTSDQVQTISENVRQRTDIYEIDTSLQNAKRLYGVEVEFPDEDQRQVLSTIDSEIGDAAYTNIKNRGSQYLGACQRLSGIFGESVRETAGKEVKKLITGDHLYQGLFYAATTGAQPQLTTEEYSGIKERLRSFEKRFRTGEYATFHKMIDSWNPEQGGTE